MIKAIIFDFFGVVGLSTYAMMAEKYDFSEQQYKESWDLHHALDAGYVSQEEFLQQYADIIGIDIDEMQTSFTEVESRMGINQPMIELIDELRGMFKVGLLTNVSENGYKFVAPIAHHFDAVVASYQVHVAKPDVAIFEIMADKLNVDVSECLMIDDSDVNCEGARSAGMNAVVFTTVKDLKMQLKNGII